MKVKYDAETDILIFVFCDIFPVNAISEPGVWLSVMTKLKNLLASNFWMLLSVNYLILKSLS